jgi:hypothetical protein
MRIDPAINQYTPAIDPSTDTSSVPQPPPAAPISLPQDSDGFDVAKAAPMSLTGDAPAPASSPARSPGNEAVQIAKSVVGMPAAELKMKDDTVLGDAMQNWVPNNINCANFVSGVLTASGQIPKSEGNAGVVNLMANLNKDPNFTKTDMNHIQPGDVAAFSVPPNGHHVMICSGFDSSGTPKFIGSNNSNTLQGAQAVSERTGVPKNWVPMDVMHYSGQPPKIPDGKLTPNLPSLPQSDAPAAPVNAPAPAPAPAAAAPVAPTPAAEPAGPVPAPTPAPAPGVFPPSPPPPAASVAAPAAAAASAAPTGTAATPTTAPAADATSAAQLNLPPRDPNAMTGSEFLAKTQNMSRADREALAVQEILNGNVPDSQRQMKEVSYQAKGKDGQMHTVQMNVLPDYISVGKDGDSVRVPLSASAAQKICDTTGCSLPTPQMVDKIYQQAKKDGVVVAPHPLPAGPQMMSNDYVQKEGAAVAGQLAADPNYKPGMLVAGDAKDVVLTNATGKNGDMSTQVGIYGWHQLNGKPIQPASVIHGNKVEKYADYSHGIRPVDSTITVDGKPMPIDQALKDPNLAPLLSNEGPLKYTRYPLYGA